MLATREILIKGANTNNDALNELARLVANELPDTEQVDCQTLARVTSITAIRATLSCDAYSENYPHLYKFIKDGGNMQKLSAKMSEVIFAGGASGPYIKSYRSTCNIFFRPQPQ